MYNYRFTDYRRWGANTHSLHTKMTSHLPCSQSCTRQNTALNLLPLGDSAAQTFSKQYNPNPASNITHRGRSDALDLWPRIFFFLNSQTAHVGNWPDTMPFHTQEACRKYVCVCLIQLIIYDVWRLFLLLTCTPNTHGVGQCCNEQQTSLSHIRRNPFVKQIKHTIHSRLQ